MEKTNGNDGLLDAALLYASLGWPVFPLVAGQKEPATPHGFKDATTDEGQVRRWWARNPRYNVGIATGNGLCVVDVDDKPERHGGVLGSDMLREWELEHGEISETVRCKTGTGGMHYYFDVGDARIDGCQSDTIFIDLRCDGGYVVAPPSVHPDTGLRYEWDISPEDMPPASANETDRACIDWVHANRRGAGGGSGSGARIPEGKLKEGEGRNEFLFRQGRSARGKGADDDTVAAFLTSLNNMKCSPPLDEAELWKTIGSVCSVPPGMSEEAKAARQGRGRPRRFEHNVAGRRLIEERGACLVDGETPAIRTARGSYAMGWDAFDAVLVELYDDCTEGNRRETKAWVKAKAESRPQAPANLVAFLNGVLDVDTMEFREGFGDEVICNVIPHRWEPSARSDVLDRTLERMACGNLETMLNLTEFMGMCMMRSVIQLPFFPVLIGEGSNGKSTYIRLLQDVVGMENISGLQPKDIAAHFMGSHIVGKTANLGDDIASGYLDDRDCSVIKSVATGDLMFTDVKGTKGFHFHPYCTMVFSCNQFPRLADTTPGFMRRLFPVEFNARFSRGDPDFDPLIGEKLRDERTLEYACVVGIEGLRRAIAQNGPTPNKMSEAMRSEIAREANTALQWFNDDAISASDLIGLTKEEAHRRYLDWCERNGYARTAMGSGTLSAQIGTFYHLKCTKIGHRTTHGERKTVKEYEPRVP